MSNEIIEVAGVVPRTRAEGPGERAAIFVQGCKIRCPQCINPELFAGAPRRAMTVGALVEAVRRSAESAPLHGVSWLGGEPMDQPGAVARAAAALRELGLSQLLFTGYTLEALRRRPEATAALEAMDAVIAGPYVAARRSSSRRWIGSDNQKLHLLTNRFSASDFQSGWQGASIVIGADEVTVSGWPDLVEALT